LRQVVRADDCGKDKAIEIDSKLLQPPALSSSRSIQRRSRLRSRPISRLRKVILDCHSTVTPAWPGW